MSDYNHGNIVQEFQTNKIESQRLMGILGGMSGKLIVPDSQTNMSSVLSAFIPEHNPHNCGYVKAVGELESQSAGNVVMSFGSTSITFANGYAGGGSFVRFTYEAFWNNDLGRICTFVSYDTPGGTGSDSGVTLVGIISDPTSITVTDDYGASGFALRGWMIVMGGGN